MIRPTSGGSSHRAWIEQALLQSDEADRHAAAAGIGALVSGPRFFQPDLFPGYLLEREIHRGGQGVVYRAIRQSTGRAVAVKVMREGPFAGEPDRHRFEREAGILARLDHRNIVGIQDFGASAGGHFLVMDFVDGRPLDRFVRECGLSISDRVRLFAAVCDAVSAAHQRGVIHRDLKPSNILVDASSAPRILDFGLAKTQDDLGESSSRGATMTGQFIGSLPWASPEQARGQHAEVDVRSDVYSLGVVLYQLVTDRFPYATTGEIGQALGAIQSAEPVRPRSISRRIDDDLETIILKCLSKEPARRYQSVGELAQDLRRYLNQEPIEAKRDSAWYMVTKSLRKYRMQVGALAAFFVIIAASAIAVGVLYAKTRTLLKDVQASSERIHLEAAKTGQVAEFAKQMIAGIDPATAGGMDKRLMRSVLDQAAARAQVELAGQPLVESEILNTVGRAYQAIGELSQAQRHLERSLEIRRQTLGEHAPETLASMNDLGMFHNEAQRYLEALPICRAAFEERRRLLGDRHPDTLTSCSNLAEVLRDLGRYDEAEDLCRRALAARREVLGEENRDTQTSLNNLALICMDLGRLDEAETLLRRSIELQERLVGADHPHTLRSMNNLAIVLKELGRLPEAVVLQERTLSVMRRVLGEVHPDTLMNKSNLAEMRRREGRLDDAEALLREVIHQRRRASDGHDAANATDLSTLAFIRGSRGDLPGAETGYREALAIYQQALQPEHWNIAKTKLSLAVALERQKKYAEAEPLMLEGYAGSVGKPEVSAAMLTSFVERIVRLYEGWDALEPGTGKAEMATAWRAKLPTPSSTAPASATSGRSRQ